MIGIDLKHYGHPRRRAADHPAEGFALGVSTFAVILVLLLHLAGIIGL